MKLEFRGDIRAGINKLGVIHTNRITVAMSMNRESVEKRRKEGQEESVLNLAKTREVEAKFRELAETETEKIISGNPLRKLQQSTEAKSKQNEENYFGRMMIQKKYAASRRANQDTFKTVPGKHMKPTEKKQISNYFFKVRGLSRTGH